MKKLTLVSGKSYHIYWILTAIC